LIITDLKPTRNKKRLNLYLDGQFAFSLEPELVVTHNLVLNQSLSSSQLEQLLHEALFAKVLTKALSLLSFRPRSCHELTQRLHLYLKKFTALSPKQTEALLTQVLKKLSQQKLLDDHKFTHWWISQRTSHKPKGNIALKHELLQKGISRALINRHLLSPSQEKILAKKLVRSQSSKLSHFSLQRQRLKLLQLLKTRGFSSNLIYSLIDEFFA
jgi:regulatory protein